MHAASAVLHMPTCPLRNAPPLVSYHKLCWGQQRKKGRNEENQIIIQKQKHPDLAMIDAVAHNTTQTKGGAVFPGFVLNFRTFWKLLP